MRVLEDVDGVKSDSKIPVTKAANELLVREAGVKPNFYRPDQINSWGFLKEDIDRRVGVEGLGESS